MDPECIFVGTLHVFDGEETKKALHLWDAAVVTFLGIKKKYPFLSVVAVASTGLYLVLLHCSFTTAPVISPRNIKKKTCFCAYTTKTFLHLGHGILAVKKKAVIGLIRTTELQLPYYFST